MTHVDRWWSTYNAALMGLHTKGASAVDAHSMAGEAADLAHGTLNESQRKDAGAGFTPTISLLYTEGEGWRYAVFGDSFYASRPSATLAEALKCAQHWLEKRGEVSE